MGLVDRSDLGRLRARGRDALDLLHRLTTADLKSLTPGRGLPAVLTSPKGRIVERLFVHLQEGGDLLLVTGGGNAARVAAHLRRFVMREDVEITDATAESRFFALIGPLAREAAAAAGIEPPERFGAASSSLAAGALVLGHDGLSSEGLSLVVPAAEAGSAGEALLAAVRSTGGSLVGPGPAEAWRILRGLPASGAELTEEHNPLEAGLWDAVSFTKGCYVGQEVVARLNTYDKVSRVLAGLVLPEGAPVPAALAEVRSADRPAGAVSSAIVPPGRLSPVALAYLKRDLPPDARLTLTIDGATIAVSRSELPFGATS